MKKILLILRFIKEYLNGDFAYKKYLESFFKHEHDNKALGKDEFLRDKRLRKGKDIRCC